jgi:hypothetical protein
LDADDIDTLDSEALVATRPKAVSESLTAALQPYYAEIAANALWAGWASHLSRLGAEYL